MAIHKIEIIDREKEDRDFIRKMIFYFKAFVIIGVVSLISYLVYSTKLFSLNVSIIIGVVLLILLWLLIKYRKKVFKRRMSGMSGSDWEQVNRIPNWAFRKMKRRHTHIVNGNHYTYKREGNNFYKRLR